jgi:hypothetical protein
MQNETKEVSNVCNCAECRSNIDKREHRSLVAYVWKSGEVTLEHPSTLIPVQHFLMNLTNDEPATREPMLLTVLQAAEINHDLHCHQHSDFGWLKVGQA